MKTVTEDTNINIDESFSNHLRNIVQCLEVDLTKKEKMSR